MWTSGFRNTSNGGPGCLVMSSSPVRVIFSKNAWFGDAAQGVIDAHVDRMHVAGEGEAVVQVGLGLLVFGVAGFDLRVEPGQPPGDAVLLGLEQIERDRSGVVGLQQLGAFVAEFVAFEDMDVPLLLRGGMELVELLGDQGTQRGEDVRRYLDAPVVVLDRGLDVGARTSTSVRRWCGGRGDRRR